MANIDIEKKNDGRGGRRTGSGRKKLENARVKTVSVSGSENEIQQLRELAKISNKSFSRFVIETILDKDN